MIAQYRVRPAIIERCNGYTCYDDLMWIAERRVRFLWLFPIWWPVCQAKWRERPEHAWQDVERDKELRSPLPATEYESETEA